LILAAYDFIDIHVNVSVSNKITLYSDQDCNGVGLLRIMNTSYIQTYQSSQSISIYTSQLDIDTGYILSGMGSASLSFTTCTSPSHQIEVGGSTGHTSINGYTLPLQITQLSLSHLSASNLTLNSLGVNGAIDIYTTANTDFLYGLSSSPIYINTTQLNFIANDNSYFPSLHVTSVNGIFFDILSNVTTGVDSMEFYGGQTCIMQQGVNINSYTFIRMAQCTWNVYVGGSNYPNTSSTWLAGSVYI